MLSIIPFDRMYQDCERPFKAYPRVPVTLPTTYYRPFPTPSFVGTVGFPGPASIASSLAASQSLAFTKRSHSAMEHHLHPSSPSHSHHLTQLTDISQSTPSKVVSSHSGVKMEHQDPNSGMCLVSSMSGETMPHENGNNHCGMRATASSSSNQPTSTSQLEHGHNGEDEKFKMPPKKRPHAVPEHMKDTGYWEKRQKNNESAKRSRDARRMKEEQIAMRVVYLEQENLQLRTEVSLLKSEIEKLRCMLYNS